jgi:hypothetical protein
MKSSVRSFFLKGTVVCFTLLFSCFVLYWLHNFLSGNFHEVIPNRVYRSAILSKQKLRYVVHRYGIRSILNLTGPHPGAQWYRDELLVAHAYRLDHADFALPAHGEISHARLQALLQVLQKLPEPLLVHCRQGADRTGLVSAFLVILHGHYAPDHWEDQVSWWYNLLSPSSIGFMMMSDYQRWLRLHRLRDSKAHFMQWVRSNQTMQTHEGWFLT